MWQPGEDLHDTPCHKEPRYERLKDILMDKLKSRIKDILIGILKGVL